MIIRPTHAPYHTQRPYDWGMGAARVMNAMNAAQQQRADAIHKRRAEEAEKERLFQVAQLKQQLGSLPARDIRSGALDYEAATGDTAGGEDIMGLASEAQEREDTLIEQQRQQATALTTAADRRRGLDIQERRLDWQMGQEPMPDVRPEMVDGVAMHVGRDPRTGERRFIGGRVPPRAPLVRIGPDFTPQRQRDAFSYYESRPEEFRALPGEQQREFIDGLLREERYEDAAVLTGISDTPDPGALAATQQLARTYGQGTDLAGQMTEEQQRRWATETYPQLGSAGPGWAANLGIPPQFLPDWEPPRFQTGVAVTPQGVVGEGVQGQQASPDDMFLTADPW